MINTSTDFLTQAPMDVVEKAIQGVLPTQRKNLDSMTTRISPKNGILLNIRCANKMVDGFAIYSPPFGAGGITWRLLLKVTDDSKVGACLGFYTSCCAFPYFRDWKVTARATLTAMGSSKTSFQRRNTDHEYSVKSNDWGYAQFAEMKDIRANCFVNNTFTVRMDVEVLKLENFYPFDKFIEVLVVRATNPMKRLREGFLDEAMALNTDALRDATGRNHYLTLKLQRDAKFLGDLKLKQSIERIERGENYSPTNDRMTVKTALMGVPLPKHLSRKMNMLPKNVRADLTAKIVHSNEIGGTVSLPCTEKGIPVCTAYCCSCNGTCYYSRNRRNMSSTASMESTETISTLDSNYSYQKNCSIIFAYSQIFTPESVGYRDGESIDFIEVGQEMSNILDPPPFEPTSSDISPTTVSCKMYSKFTPGVLPSLPANFEKICGMQKDGKDRFQVVRESILRDFLTGILQDQCNVPFEDFIYNVNLEGLINYERIFTICINFFETITPIICRNTAVLPPHKFAFKHVMQHSLEAFTYIEKCAGVINDALKSSGQPSDCKRSKIFSEVSRAQNNIIGALQDRIITAKIVRADTAKLLTDLRNQLEAVKSFEEGTRVLHEKRQSIYKRLNKIEHSFECRDHERKTTYVLEDIIKQQKEVVDAVAAEGVALKKNLFELKAMLKQTVSQYQNDLKENNIKVANVVQKKEAIKKETIKFKNNSQKIVEQDQVQLEKHRLQILALEKFKIEQEVGILADDIDDYLEHCDNGLRERGRRFDRTHDRNVKSALEIEMDVLRAYEKNAKALQPQLAEFLELCFTLLDEGQSYEALPKLPMFELPEVPPCLIGF